MRRAALLLCGFGALAMAARAQPAPPDPAVVIDRLEKQLAPFASAWLNSADPRVEAWGAYQVLRDQRTDAIPVLLSLLAAYPVIPQEASQLEVDRHDAMLGVLDALIQFDAPVPAGDSQRIYPEFPVQSLILLARSQEDTTDALLDIFRNEQRWQVAWLAAGNLLAARRAGGFAATVIEGMTVHVQVIVTEPLTGVGFGGGSSCCMGGSTNPKAGWPPLGVYSFGGCGEHAQAGATLLAGGADPAYYDRQVSAIYRAGGISGCCHLDQDLVREHYLTALLPASAGEPVLRAHVSHSIVWRGVEAYRRAMAEVVADQQHVFEEATRRLGERALLSGDERTLRPALQIFVLDQRASRQSPLPVLDELPGNVTIQ
ncbi:MAG TPA: hypothetical protein VMR62_11540 [Bryobacteraceae bacterium]|jgi:hypothetical protein|nr:hypothetical protein [Bryobacteraceae bacterium]